MIRGIMALLSRNIRTIERFSPSLRMVSVVSGHQRKICWTTNYAAIDKMISCTPLHNVRILDNNRLIVCRGVSTMRSSGEKGQRTCGKCSHVYASYIPPGGGEGMDFVKVVSCPKCGALQKMKGSGLPNYFEILGETESYRVDGQAISNKAKQLQKTFHPDLYSQKGEDQQLLSQEYSSLINKAVSTLLDPISRGRYMLSISGLSPEDPDSDLEKSMTNDPEFLEEVMELNFKLEEITSEQDWKEFRNQNAYTMNLIQTQLAKAFDGEQLNEAQRLLGRLKYYHTLQHKLKELQSKIGIVE